MQQVCRAMYFIERDQKILDRLKIDLNLRPQNINLETYYKLACEYENLRS